MTEKTFHFNGRRIRATEGMTIGGALHDSGVRILTRSFKFHRPRGYTCGYGACGGCPLTVDGLPGVAACETPLRGGEQVETERGWPSARFDILSATNLVKPFLGAGFQFRHLQGHPRLAHRFERVMAHVAGAGRMPTADAALQARALESRTLAAAVVVVGGGLSGCVAALAAADAGAHVALIHRGELGGRSLSMVDTITLPGGETRRRCDVAMAVAIQVRSHPRIEHLSGTVVARFSASQLVAVVGRSRVVVDARALIVATGSYDVPFLIPGNDKPGVMLPGGVRRLLHGEGVRPGRRAVVIAEDELGREMADELTAAGVVVVAVVGTRAVPLPTDPLVSVRGIGRARRVVVRHGASGRSYRCDLVVMVRPERPAEELVVQSSYLVRGDTDWSCPGGRTDPGAELVVGSAAGHVVPDLDHAREVGLAACR